MLAHFARIAFYTNQKIVFLKDTVQAIPEASYSPLLSLAAFVMFHQPNLPPPNYTGKMIDKNHSDTHYPCQQLSYNNYYQPWCDFLTQLIISNNYHQQQHQIFFFVQIQHEFLEKLNNKIFVTKQQEISEQASTTQILEKCFQIKIQLNSNRKNIGIANFATSQLRNDPNRPKVHLGGLLMGFWPNNHNWQLYDILKGHYPTDQQFEQMDVLILTGSSLSINDCVPEVQQFIQIYKSKYEKLKKLKVLCLCFGHQFVTKAYGGKVVKRPKYAGLEKIQWSIKFKEQLTFLNQHFQSDRKYLLLSQYHSDYVDLVPEGFEILAYSNSCQVEGIISKDRRMLSMQFHPQYSTQYTKSYELRVAHYAVDDVLADFCGTGETSLEHKESIFVIRRCLSKFMEL